MKISLLLLTTVLCLDVASQISRKVLDAQTNQPVSYATIKVLNKPLGTISTDKGEFTLPIENTDSVLITSVGYERIILTAIGTVVYLTPKVKTLAEVIIGKNKLLRTILLGDKKKKVDDGQNWGPGIGKEEFAQRILLPDSMLTYKIKNIYVPVKKIGDWGPLLLRIYEQDPLSEYPGEELLTKAVFFKSSDVANKQACIDVSNENVIIRKAKTFFISIGWLDETFLPERNGAKALTTIQLLKAPRDNTYTRHLGGNYQWYPFGIMKDLKGDLFELSTFYSVEVDEMSR